MKLQKGLGSQSLGSDRKVRAPVLIPYQTKQREESLRSNDGCEWEHCESRLVSEVSECSPAAEKKKLLQLEKWVG